MAVADLSCANCARCTGICPQIGSGPSDRKIVEVQVLSSASFAKNGGNEMPKKLSIDTAKLSFNCPGCGQKITESVGRLKKDGNACPGCGLRFETDKLARGIEECNKDVAKLGTQMKKLFG